MSEAPERIYMDPDIKFPECEKQYGCDVEYVRADIIEETNRHFVEMADKIEELEAKLDLSEGALDIASKSWGECNRILEQTEAKLQTQTQLIEQFFALMDITEQTDEGRDFKPNRIYSRRVMDAEKLEKVLAELKQTLKEEE